MRNCERDRVVLTRKKVVLTQNPFFVCFEIVDMPKWFRQQVFVWWKSDRCIINMCNWLDNCVSIWDKIWSQTQTFIFYTFIWWCWHEIYNWHYYEHNLTDIFILVIHDTSSTMATIWVRKKHILILSFLYILANVYLKWGWHGI